jgi:cytochrome c oxidase cbb3-type subunit 1
MSETSQPPPPVDGTDAPVAPSAIDASCRVPVLLLFAGTAFWLVAGLLLGFLASVKFHSPAFLASSPWLTYGRIQPAGMNALVYGFCLPTAVGVALWMLARLGRTPLVRASTAVMGGLLWNLGVVAGLYGILKGDSTGFELLEMPAYAAPLLFVAFAFLAASAFLTFQARRVTELYVSHWFLIAALFWFAWIFSTANLLLLFRPVRGVMQALVNWWYLNNLLAIVLGFFGLAIIFYFVPKLTRRPLHSYALALFAFWALVLFAPWGGLPPGAPLPAWIPSVSSFFTFLTVIPALAVAVNLGKTLFGRDAAVRDPAATGNVPLRFMIVGALALLAFTFLGAAMAFREVSSVTHFTWLVRAQTQLFLLGFVTMVLLGAMHYIIPALLPDGEFCPKGARITFLTAVLGALLTVLPLLGGGVREGLALTSRPDAGFMDIAHSSLMWLRVSTTGELLLLLSGLGFAFNFSRALVTACRACCLPAWKAVSSSQPAPAEVTP